MKKEKKICFVPYDSLEYYAVEGWLDEQARAGWQLRKFYGAYAAFQRAEPAQTRYRLDILSSEKYDMEQEIREESAQQGWEYVCDFSWHNYSVFRCNDPEAVELHSDPAVLRTVLKKKTIFVGIALAVLLIWLLIGCFQPNGLAAIIAGWSLPELYTGNLLYRLIAMVALLVFWLLFASISISSLCHAWRDLEEGCSVKRRSAWIRPTIYFVLTCLAVTALILLIGPADNRNTEFVSLQDWTDPLPVMTWGEFAPEEYNAYGNDDFLFEYDAPFADSILMIRQMGLDGEQSLFYDENICRMKTPALRQKLFDAYLRELAAELTTVSDHCAYYRNEYLQIWIYQHEDTVIRVIYNGAEDLSKLEAKI